MNLLHRHIICSQLILLLHFQTLTQSSVCAHVLWIISCFQSNLLVSTTGLHVVCALISVASTHSKGAAESS